MRISPALLLACILLSCGTDAPEETTVAPPVNNAGTNTAEAQATSGNTAWKERDAWQRPEVVIDMMGGDLSGMVVADLFAGDGYFTARLLDAGAKVIAIENDPANVKLLEELKRQRGLGDDRLIIRAVPVGDPGLAADEVDMALMTHHFTRITDRPSYFKMMRRGMRYPRILFVVDWQAKQTPLGPPLAQRMAPEQVMEAIGSLGYTDVGFHAARIPDQVIYIATDPMEEEPANGPQ